MHLCVGDSRNSFARKSFGKVKSGRSELERLLSCSVGICLETLCLLGVSLFSSFSLLLSLSLLFFCLWLLSPLCLWFSSLSTTFFSMLFFFSSFLLLLLSPYLFSPSFPTLILSLSLFSLVFFFFSFNQSAFFLSLFSDFFFFLFLSLSRSCCVWHREVDLATESFWSLFSVNKELVLGFGSLRSLFV